MGSVNCIELRERVLELPIKKEERKESFGRAAGGVVFGVLVSC